MNHSFYGSSKWSTDVDLKVRLARRERAFAQASLPSLYRPRITGPNHAWKIFNKQCDAFKYLAETDQDLHVFSFESEKFARNSGQRCFLVTSYEEFWHYYSQLASQQRHHYEVIAEGARCHLYFDLEFMRKTNPDVDGVELTQTFVRFVLMMLNKQWTLDCNATHVLQLDASTLDKFSRHLIFRLPEKQFQDNIHAGSFVKHIINILLYNVNAGISTNISRNESETKDPDDIVLSDDVMASCDLNLTTLKKLVVKNQHGKDTLFCDMGVYTKNRNFRLYLSCKLGKKNPMILAPENEYIPETTLLNNDKNECSPPKVRKISEEETIFLSSLITNTRCDETTTILRFEEAVNCNPRYNTIARNHVPSSNILGSISEGNKSPFPEVDDFINRLINQGDIRGRIRRWTFNAEANTLMYDIAENRWCENIGRQHRSNNIMFIADLKDGIYYQKCHDPDCKIAKYKSPERPLPESILDLYSCREIWTETTSENNPNTTQNEVSSLIANVSESEGYSRTEEMSDEELLNLIAIQNPQNCNSSFNLSQSSHAECETVISGTRDEKTYGIVNCDSNKTGEPTLTDLERRRLESISKEDIENRPYTSITDLSTTGFGSNTYKEFHHRLNEPQMGCELSDDQLIQAVNITEENIEVDTKIQSSHKYSKHSNNQENRHDNDTILQNETCLSSDNCHKARSSIEDTNIIAIDDISNTVRDTDNLENGRDVRFDNDFINDDELLNATLELEDTL